MLRQRKSYSVPAYEKQNLYILSTSSYFSVSPIFPQNQRSREHQDSFSLFMGPAGKQRQRHSMGSKLFALKSKDRKELRPFQCRLLTLDLAELEIQECQGMIWAKLFFVAICCCANPSTEERSILESPEKYP